LGRAIRGGFETRGQGENTLLSESEPTCEPIGGWHARLTVRRVPVGYANTRSAGLFRPYPRWVWDEPVTFEYPDRQAKHVKGGRAIHVVERKRDDV
jgi:hypothetical protein